MGEDGALNFDNAKLEGAVVQAARPFHLFPDAVAPAFAIGLMLGVVFLSLRWCRRGPSRAWHQLPRLADWPRALQLAVLVTIGSYLLTHLFSALSVYYVTQVASPSPEFYFRDMGVGRLLSLSHAHFFGHATMYFLLAFLVSFTRGPEWVTTGAPVVALWAGVFDVVAWWGAKFVSPNFEVLSMLCGLLFSLGFLLMSWTLVKEIGGRTSV